MELEMSGAGTENRWRRFARFLAVGAAWFLVSLFTFWAFVALCFDARRGWLRFLAAAFFALCLLANLFFVRQPWRRLATCGACSTIVLLWWLSLAPSNIGRWQADVSETAYAELHGDQVVIHNVRNCDYRSEFDYTCRWETRTYDLSQLRGMDAYFVHWGSPLIAHTMLSFQFGTDDYIVFSVETRKKIGQSYSAIRGFFRQYELIYTVSGERDVIRLRTNYRIGEDVFLYHLTTNPARSRIRFQEYVDRLNELHDRPEWYNALTSNCTTNIFTQRQTVRGEYYKLTPWDWQVLLNGKLDERVYGQGIFAGSLP